MCCVREPPEQQTVFYILCAIQFVLVCFFSLSLAILSFSFVCVCFVLLDHVALNVALNVAVSLFVELSFYFRLTFLKFMTSLGNCIYFLFESGNKNDIKMYQKQYAYIIRQARSLIKQNNFGWMRGVFATDTFLLC